MYYVHRALLKKAFTELKCNKSLESGVQVEKSKAIEFITTCLHSRIELLHRNHWADKKLKVVPSVSPQAHSTFMKPNKPISLIVQYLKTYVINSMP